MARGGLQHVPGDEPRQTFAGRAMCINIEPQLRRPARPRWPHAPRLTRDGGGSGVRWAFCRHPRVEITLMKAFTKHTGRVVAMDRANVDTDQIIPKQFLKRIERTGFGEFLFWDWARDLNGKVIPDFELNRPEAQGASVLLARQNFGCGSSRE